MHFPFFWYRTGLKASVEEMSERSSESISTCFQDQRNNVIRLGPAALKVSRVTRAVYTSLVSIVI